MPGVGGEAAGRVERAVAVVRRARQPPEHRVEAPRQRAQLGRAADGDRALEVALGLDTGRRGAQPPQRAQDEVGREPDPGGRDEQHGDADQREAAAQRGAAVLEVLEAGGDLEADEAAEAGVAQRLGVGAVARPADGGRVEPERRRPVRVERDARVEEHRVADREAQRAARRAQDGVEAAVGVGQPLLDRGDRGRARELGRAPQPVVEHLALGAVDLPGDDDARRRRGRPRARS